MGRSGWLGAAWYGRGQKLAADRAAAAAERSAEEARRSADHSAELVAIERARRADEEVEAENRLVDFMLIPVRRHEYQLTNAGTATAYEVKVHLQEGADAGPGYFITFDPGQTADYRMPHGRPMTVVWHQRFDQSDPARRKVLEP